MSSARRNFVRVESAEAYDLRNNGGSLTPIVGLLEYVAA
jgi:hypothetical protein